MSSRWFGRVLGFACAAAALASPSVAWADRSSTTIEQGYEGGEIQHPRLVGMGGAMAALGTSTNAIFANPANLALARVYHFEGLAAVGPEARRQSYGGAVADSSTNRLAGGIGGTWNIMDPDGVRRIWTDIRLALAFPFADRFAIGLTGRYLRVTQSIASGPLGGSLASDGLAGEPIVNNFTFDAGASVIPFGGLRIGAFGRNLTVPNHGFMPTQTVLGIGYTSGMFSFEGDWMTDFTTFSGVRMKAMAGGEVLVADRVPIRLGYRYDDALKTHSASAGVGYVDRKWSVEIGARRDLVSDHPATTIAAGVRFFYDQLGANEDPETNGAL